MGVEEMGSRRNGTTSSRLLWLKHSRESEKLEVPRQ